MYVAIAKFHVGVNKTICDYLMKDSFDTHNISMLPIRGLLINIT